jgi:hypothetical protein
MIADSKLILRHILCGGQPGRREAQVRQAKNDWVPQTWIFGAERLRTSNLPLFIPHLGFRDNLAVEEMDFALGVAGEARIVRDHAEAHGKRLACQMAVGSCHRKQTTYIARMIEVLRWSVRCGTNCPIPDSRWRLTYRGACQSDRWDQFVDWAGLRRRAPFHLGAGNTDVYTDLKCGETGWQIANPIYDISLH